MNGKPSKLKPALIAGVALGAASAVPILNCLNVFCCALAIGGGLLASYLYLKELGPQTEAPYGDGALVGLLSGLVGGVVCTVVSIPINLVFQQIMPDQSQSFDQLREVFEQNDIPLELVDFLEKASSGSFDLVFTCGAMLVYSLAFGIFALLGGILGAMLFKKG